MSSVGAPNISADDSFNDVSQEWRQITTSALHTFRELLLIARFFCNLSQTELRYMTNWLNHSELFLYNCLTPPRQYVNYYLQRRMFTCMEIYFRATAFYRDLRAAIFASGYRGTLPEIEIRVDP